MDMFLPPHTIPLFHTPSESLHGSVNSTVPLFL
jgi:hypothetical protein